MKMTKKQFRIGQLAQELQVERFVIRFWEKEFKLKPTRSDGGQRFYTDTDLETFKKIKTLLYEQGFTIAGAKKALGKKSSDKPFVASKKTVLEQAPESNEPLNKRIIYLQKQLIKLRELL